ncbi:MAG: sigma-54-dependent Fis family transcriptional regulator [Dehalococcoidia bacterium]|uniref:sigma-54-dependent Fis family transcriptional regulator n=1 Tax=Pseudonocardia sp. TaxID=60912 RepID=UPI003D0D599D
MELDELARARWSFLTDDVVPSGAVRQPILASWSRSRTGQVQADRLDLPFDANIDPDCSLLRAARPVLQDLADRLSNEPVSVILCDSEGVVLRRTTGDSRLQRCLDQVLLAPGFSYAEQHIGTNGIGTALEGGGPTIVFGHEHYVDPLAALACAAAPIRHPISGKILGVIDITCWVRDTSPALAVTVPSIAQQIENSLSEQLGSREHVLLRDYLQASRRSRGAVLAVSDGLLLMNDHARDWFSSADQTAILTNGTDALRSGGRRQLVVDLPSGVTARVQCRPSAGAESKGVLIVHTQDSPSASAGRRAVAPTAEIAQIAHPAVGSTPAWSGVRDVIERSVDDRLWLILEGEPGTGKVSLARAAHETQSPTRELRILDAAGYGPKWINEVSDALGSGRSLVLAHVERLPAEGLRELRNVLLSFHESAGADGPWVVATVSTSLEDGLVDLADLPRCFPRTVEVPALRHHIDDLPELISHFFASTADGAALSLSPDALRLLMRNRWPGNIEQLRQVVRKVVGKRRVGRVGLRDLPSECYVISRRQLTALEAVECDAIVGALLSAGGNKIEAARNLGISRATIFRKIRTYGIVIPRISSRTDES